MDPTHRRATSLEFDWDAHSSSSISEQTTLSPHSTPPSVASTRATPNRSTVMNFSWTPTVANAHVHHEIDAASATGVPGRSQQNGANPSTTVRQRAGIANEPAWSMPMGIADGVIHHQQTTLQVPSGITSGGVVSAPVQQPAHDHQQVMPYVSVDDFADIIRKLYLPYEVPRWQQLVRAAVLVVGLVEELHRNGGHTGLHHVVHPREYVPPAEWISAWLDLQPRSRFSGPKASVVHPGMLLYPATSTLEDWGMFLTHSRQVVFRVLLGLKSCSPYVTHATKPALMSEDDWVAWADDVLWVIFQVLNHVKLYKHAQNIHAQAPQASRSLPAARRETSSDHAQQGWGNRPTDGSVIPATSSGTQSSYTPNASAYAVAKEFLSEHRGYRKRSLEDPKESGNKRFRATDIPVQDREYPEGRYVVEEDRDEEMYEESGEAY
ncbi:hypothetical protein C8T65DRAFT_696751 [Cerioporus squamosus]|nr:hypothetical protein C8T65DRAFT_696751 [Cerioporus squamosus]